MKWNERVRMIRRYGPKSPTQRHILEVLTFYDDDDGRPVFGGCLAEETGFGERCIRYNLRALVELGWLIPEKPARPDDPRVAGRVHGHQGGRQAGGKGCSTRYRINYLATPRGHDMPLEGGTSCHGQPTSEGSRGHVVPLRGHDVPVKGARDAPDSGSTENDPPGGDTPPPPPPTEGGTADAVPPVAAVAARFLVAPPREAIDAAAVKAWCTVKGSDWFDVFATAGCTDVAQVPEILNMLKQRCEADHGPKRPPYRASDFAPYADPVRIRREKIEKTFKRKAAP